MSTFQNSPPQPPAPRLAYVLGSGGVRSMAALGAHEVFVRHGIHPDLIAGCSSGALFGASLAIGLPADKAAALMMSIWSQNLTEQRNWRGYAQLLAPKLMRFGPAFSLRDARCLHERIAAACAGRRIESLPIALRVAVTDAASGEPLVLTEGDLGSALCASIAVPFLFPSVEIDGRWLVDGVVSDPLPVAAALDARVIVALALEGPMPRRVDRASRLAAQATTALINNLQRARLDAARQRGAQLIELQLQMPRRVGLWDAAALPEAFEAGRRAALAVLPRLRMLLAPEPDAVAA
jgi:NTE family protein